MSQLFDYYACTPAQIQQLAEAMKTFDEERQANAEGAVLAMVSLRNVNQDDVFLLAECATEHGDRDADAMSADLYMEVNEEEGLVLLTYPRPAIQAIAALTVTDELLERWIEASVDFNGSDIQYARESLTQDAAQKLKQLCQKAVENDVRVYVCLA